MAHIYRILNVVTDHFYVGSSVNFKKRKWEHLNALKNRRHHCKALQMAWEEYGTEAFEFEVLEDVLDEDALRIEDTYLLRWAGQSCCYNTMHTSLQSPAATRAETRAKISDSLRGKYIAGEYVPRLGKTHSAGTKAKISAAKLANPSRHWLGKERSVETKEKIGAAQRGVAKAPRTFTPEGLERARENMKRNAKPQVLADFEAVHAKFPADVQAKYNFNNAVYLGALVRIEGVSCEQHGVFSQYAAQFRKGRGCPTCGAEQRAESKRIQMKQAWATEDGRKIFMENRTSSLHPPEK
jgi:group I intron endonuclease